MIFLVPVRTQFSCAEDSNLTFPKPYLSVSQRLTPAAATKPYEDSFTHREHCAKSNKLTRKLNTKMSDTRTKPI